jgi:hypothetical protein
MVGPAEVTVDEKDAAATRRTGNWTVSVTPGGWAGRSLWSKGADARFRWTPNLPAAGNYEVYAWWTANPKRTATAPYLIAHASGTATVTVNQREAGSGAKWRLLGTYAFQAGSEGYVELSGQQGEACADAVRFVFKSAPQEGEPAKTGP